MNNKAVFLSGIVAFLAILFVQSYVDSVEKQNESKYGDERMVLRAKRDIQEQETLTVETALEFKSVPANFLEPGAIAFDGRALNAEGRKAAEEKLMKMVVGNVAIVPIRNNEQITYNKMAQPGVKTGLAPQVAPGRRAISLAVNELTGVSRLIKPGDRVDVIGILDVGGGDPQGKLSKVLMQDVVILATGLNVTNNPARVVETDPASGKERVRTLSSDRTFSTVTIEVEPLQAQMLTLVMNIPGNQLTLSLRNNDDSERVNGGAIAISDVLGNDAAKVRLPASGGRR